MLPVGHRAAASSPPANPTRSRQTTQLHQSRVQIDRPTMRGDAACLAPATIMSGTRVPTSKAVVLRPFAFLAQVIAVVGPEDDYRLARGRAVRAHPARPTLASVGLSRRSTPVSFSRFRSGRIAPDE